MCKLSYMWCDLAGAVDRVSFDSFSAVTKKCACVCVIAACIWRARSNMLVTCHCSTTRWAVGKSWTGSRRNIAGDSRPGGDSKRYPKVRSLLGQNSEHVAQ